MQRLSTWLGVFFVLAGGTLAACASAEPSPMAPPVRCTDCDGGPMSTPPDAELPPSATEGPVAAGLAVDASADDLATCYDGQDNDRDGLFDCSSPNCAQLASCCVGATSIGCCAPPELGPTMALGACVGGLDGCGSLPGLVGFGTPSPTVNDARLFPNGDASHDSGVVLTRALDPQRAIVVDGVLATPVGDCDDGCFESVALGIIAARTPGPDETLRPLAAVVASAARREIALVLAGETAGRLSLASARPVSVSLVLLPTGVVTLHVQDADTDVELGSLSGRIVPSADPVQLAVYGHNVNRSGASLTPSYASDVSVSTALCDAPSRWVGRTAITIGTGADTLGPASAPSFAYGGGQTFVAFASEGALVFGRADGEDLSTGFALLAANRRFSIPGVELGDPDVHYDAAVGATPERYTVYYANRTIGSIERIRIGPDGTVFEGPTIWLNSLLDEAFIESIDGPSVLRPAAGTSGPTHVFARVHTLFGDTRIVRFALASETDAFTKPDDWDAVTVRTTQPDFGAFDRDEVAAPAAYRHNGSLQVAFAGRSGARWALGLMVTDDPRVVLWRRAPAPTILSASGSGFDALSVRDPAIVATGTNVELLYAGSDGVTEVLGYVRRDAASFIGGGP